jgi:hypothetical protein
VLPVGGIGFVVGRSREIRATALKQLAREGLEPLEKGLTTCSSFRAIGFLGYHRHTISNLRRDFPFLNSRNWKSRYTTTQKEDSMKHLNIAMLAGSVLFAVVIAGCGSSPAVNNEASTSAIRAAEESGASKVPSASLYLQLAKEELENARGLAAKGEKEQAESLLLRAQADGELAVALSRGDADKTEATQAIERVRQLRQDNQLPQERK